MITRMDEGPLVAAWLDDGFAEAYADICSDDQAIRDRAQAVIDVDPIAALGYLIPHLDTWDDVYAVVSWLDAPEIWNRSED